MGGDVPPPPFLGEALELKHNLLGFTKSHLSNTLGDLQMSSAGLIKIMYTRLFGVNYWVQPKAIPAMHLIIYLSYSQNFSLVGGGGGG